MRVSNLENMSENICLAKQVKTRRIQVMNPFIGGLNGDDFYESEDTCGEDSVPIDIEYCPKCGEGGLVRESGNRLVIFSRLGVATFWPPHVCKKQNT